MVAIFIYLTKDFMEIGYEVPNRCHVSDRQNEQTVGIGGGHQEDMTIGWFEN